MILLVAFALRAHHLTFESLGRDEAMSLQRAAEPLRAMLAAMPAEYAPGYFVALRGWMAFAGDSDYALRFFSLLGGVLAVALLQRLSSDLARPSAVRRWIGLLSATLLATNAFHVAYAQEARMYAWLLTLSLAATLALWHLLNPREQRDPVHRYAAIGWGIVYAPAIAACVYLHNFGALVALAHLLYVTGWVITTRRWKAAGLWAAWAAVGLLLFAPWLPRALGAFGLSGPRTDASAAEIPLRYLVAYSGAAAMPAPWNAIIPWTMLALAILGAVWWVRTRPDGAMLVGALALIPFGAVLLPAARNPDYHEQYTTFIGAALIALASAGTIALEPRLWSRDRARRRLSGLPVATAAVAAILVGANFAALANTYGNSALHKPDYRAAATRIQAEEHPGDVILLSGPDSKRLFTRYYTGALSIVDLHDLEGAPSAEVDAYLRATTADAKRVWELLYAHDLATAQIWLATRAWATQPTNHNNLRVTLYGLGNRAQDVASPSLARQRPLAFGKALTLERVALAPPQLSRGDVLRVSTDWLTHSAPPDWTFSLRMNDAVGNPVLFADYKPQNQLAPTSTWAVGQPARDQHGLLADTLASGVYTVTLRLYDETSGTPVVTTVGEDVALGVVEVLP